MGQLHQNEYSTPILRGGGAVIKVVIPSYHNTLHGKWPPVDPAPLPIIHALGSPLKRRTRTCTQKCELTYSFSFYGSPPAFMAAPPAQFPPHSWVLGKLASASALSSSSKHSNSTCSEKGKR